MLGRSIYKKFSMPIFSVFTAFVIISNFFGGLNNNQNVLAAQQSFTCKPSIPQVAGESLDSKLDQDTKAIDDTNNNLTKNINDLRNPFSFNKEQSENKIRDLASNRKDLLIKIMRQNPNAALSKILSENDRRDVLSLTTNCVETQATIEGQLETIHADFTNNQTADYYMVTTSNGEKIQLRPAKGFGINSISGSKVKVNGYRLDNEILFDGASPIGLSSIENSPSVNASTNTITDAVGTQRTAAIMVNFPLFPPLTLSKTTVNDTVFNKTKNYYTENSYNKTLITGSTYGTYPMGISMTCSTANILNETIKKSDPYIDFSQFDRLVIVGPFNNCGWAGMGTLGKWNVTTNEGTLPLSVAWMPTGYFGQTTVSHEYGHNLGDHHASSQSCSGLVSPSTPCGYSEYGDRYDIMGTANSGHMNAPHKEHIGFFEPSNIQNVTASGTYILEPIETNTTGLKMLKIPRGGADYLFIEFRQPLGYDATLINNAGNIFEGALLHTLEPIEAANSRTLLISATFGGKALPVGSSITDPATGVTVATLSKTSSALTVKIDGIYSIPTTPTLTPAPTAIVTPNPTLTPSPTATPTPTSTPTIIPTPTASPTPTPTPIITTFPTPSPTSAATDKTPPAVSITSPVNYTNVKMGTTIQVKASATDNIGVARVEFYAGSTLICTATIPSGNIFACNWNIPNTYVGYYILTAKAYDTTGNVGTSIGIYVFPRWY